MRVKLSLRGPAPTVLRLFVVRDRNGIEVRVEYLEWQETYWGWIEGEPELEEPIKKEAVPWLVWTLLVSFWIALGVGLVYVGAAVLKVSALNLAILLVLFVTSYIWGGGTMHSMHPTWIAVLGVFAGFLALYLTSPLHSSPAVWPWFVFLFLAFMMFLGFVQLPAAPVTEILRWLRRTLGVVAISRALAGTTQTLNDAADDTDDHQQQERGGHKERPH